LPLLPRKIKQHQALTRKGILPEKLLLGAGGRENNTIEMKKNAQRWLSRRPFEEWLINKTQLLREYRDGGP